MTSRSSRPGRKELYSATMVIFIGLFYLLTSGITVLQSDIATFNSSEMKMLLLAVFYLFSGVILLLRKHAGWIFSAAILLNFVFVMLVFIVSLSQSGGFNTYALMAIFLFFLLLLSFLFLFSRDIRRKYEVNNKSYLLTLICAGLLAWVNFGL